MLPDQTLNGFNLIANVVTLLGAAIAIYVLINVRRIVERLEQVIAPKTGIEGFLQMCAQVVESDPDGTCVVDDSGEIVLVNKRMEEISGYHRSELVGQQVEILVPDSIRREHPQHREGFITGPSSRPMRGLTLRHKRGREVAVGINLNHYVDAAGGFTIAKVRAANDDWRRKSQEIPVMSE